MGFKNARQAYLDRRYDDAATSFTRLYKDGHNLFTLPYLKALKRHVKDEGVLDEILSIGATPMAQQEFQTGSCYVDKIQDLLRKKEQNTFTIAELPEIIFANLCNEADAQKRSLGIATQLDRVQNNPNLYSYWLNVTANMGDLGSIHRIIGPGRSGELADDNSSIYRDYAPFLVQSAKCGNIWHGLYTAQAFFMGGRGSFQINYNQTFNFYFELADQLDKNYEKTLRELAGYPASMIYLSLADLYRHPSIKAYDLRKRFNFLEKAIELGSQKSSDDLFYILYHNPEIFLQEDLVQKQKKWFKIFQSKSQSLLARVQIEHPDTRSEYEEGVRTMKEFSKDDIQSQFYLAESLDKVPPCGESKSQKNARVKEAQKYMHFIIRNTQNLHEIQKENLAYYISQERFGLKKNDKQSFELFLQANTNGNSCDLQLAKCFHFGIGTEIDTEKALDHYKRHIENPKIPLEKKASEFNAAGVILLSKQEYAQAIEFLERAMGLGNVDSFNNRAIMWDKGFGCERNLEKACELYQISADKGNADAQENLGLKYLFELNDYEKAHFWLKKAEEKGNLKARHYRTLLFLSGVKGEDQTVETVKETIIKDAMSGSFSSKFLLALSYSFDKNPLHLQKNTPEARRLLSEVSQNPQYSKIAEILMMRLGDEDSDNEMDEVLETRPTEKQTHSDDLIQKEIQESMLEQKRQKQVEKEIKRQHFFEKMREQGAYQKSTSEDASLQETREDPFTLKEIELLEEFASQRGGVKTREIMPILKLLGARETKSGYVIDGMVGGHRTHGSDIVNKCAVKELKDYVRETFILDK